MAEYITIMIINNKTAGMYIHSSIFEFHLTTPKPRSRLNWRTVSTVSYLAINSLIKLYFSSNWS